MKFHIPTQVQKYHLNSAYVAWVAGQPLPQRDEHSRAVGLRSTVMKEFSAAN